MDPDELHATLRTGGLGQGAEQPGRYFLCGGCTRVIAHTATVRTDLRMVAHFVEEDTRHRPSRRDHRHRDAQRNAVRTVGFPGPDRDKTFAVEAAEVGPVIGRYQLPKGSGRGDVESHELEVGATIAHCFTPSLSPSGIPK